MRSHNHIDVIQPMISGAFPMGPQVGEWCSRRAASAIEPLIDG